MRDSVIDYVSRAREKPSVSIAYIAMAVFASASFGISFFMLMVARGTRGTDASYSTALMAIALALLQSLLFSVPSFLYLVRCRIGRGPALILASIASAPTFLTLLISVGIFIVLK